MPIPIDEVDEDPIDVYNYELDIIDLLEHNNKLAYTPREIYEEITKAIPIDNPLSKSIKILTFPFFVFDLVLMVQKGYIKSGNKHKYYFASLKSDI